MLEGHRKQVRHRNSAGHARELTFSCYRRLSLLRDLDAYALFGSAISEACSRHSFDVIAFVLMPEHVHLLVFPRGDPAVSALLKAIKQATSRRFKSRLAVEDPMLLESLTIRERPGKTVFRFWQEGPGFDRNLFRREAVRASIDYIHLNPVRRGLCEHPREWRWSSWRSWHEPETSDPRMPAVVRLPP